MAVELKTLKNLMQIDIPKGFPENANPQFAYERGIKEGRATLHEDLKQEAIKWVKEWLKDIPSFTWVGTKAIFDKDIPLDERPIIFGRVGLVITFMNFFNLTEEDLK